MNINGYTGFSEWDCHSLTSARILSVILLTISAESSIPYGSPIWSWMSRVLIPRAYREITFFSIPDTSLWYFWINFGLNSPFRSLGKLIWNSPYWLLRVFGEWPFLLLLVSKSPFLFFHNRGIHPSRPSKVPGGYP